MKKLLFLGAMAAMLLGTASCSNDMEPAMTDDGTVQFTIELPGNVDSRAISDGLSAEDLQVAVYKEDGTLLNDISLLGDKKVTMSNKKATVTFKLVKGLTYKFAFWAQKPGCEAYAFDASTGKVTVDYSKAVANVDDGDAFSNTATLTVTGPMTETIYLYRPFAQLNYGDVMEDYAAATAAGIDFSKTQVTVKQVATEFDIMNQKTSATGLVDVTWPAAASAIGENLKVENVDYKWLSMCYFLVPNDEATVNTELSLLNNAGTEFNKLNVSNVPVQKNHRTNILGNLFTDDVNFNIIIDERFQQPDNNVDINGRPYLATGAIQVGVNGEQYNTLADAIAAANGETVYLGAGTYNEAIVATDGQTVSIASAGGLTAADVIINKQVKAETGSTLDLKNVTVKTNNAVTDPAIDIVGATATLDGIKADGSRGVSIEDGSTVTITNSNIAATGSQGYPRGVQLVGENNNVTVEGSNISAVHYAFNFIGGANSNTINLKNSTVTGWGVVNIWSSNNNIEFDNCVLNSINDKSYNADGWNNFSAFVYNNDGSNIARDNVVTILNSKVNVTSTKGNKQSLIGYAGYNNKTIFKNVNVVGTDTNTDEPLTIRSYGCDFFDENNQFIGTNEMLANLCNCTDNVTCTWNGNPLDLVEYFTFE